MLNPITTTTMARPGHTAIQGALDKKLARRVEHATPGGSRRKLAKPEEGEARLGKHGDGGRQGGLHDDGRQDIGKM